MAINEQKDANLVHLSDEITHVSENSDINFKSVGYVDEIEVLLQDVKVLFVKQCKWIVYSLATIWAVETILLVSHVIKPDERIFTERVLMTLIGATIVQVGTIITGIAIRRGRSSGRGA